MSTHEEIRMAERIGNMQRSSSNLQQQQYTCKRMNHAVVVSSLFLLVAFVLCGDEVAGFSLKRGCWSRLTMKLSSSSDVQSTGRQQTFTPNNTRRDQLGNSKSRKNDNDNKSTSASRRQSLSPPPGSPLSMICNDQDEYELNVGHCMDILRSDYPDILTVKPDFSIYDRDLEVIDPSGVKLHGLDNYKSAFSLLHAIVNIFYCPERSGLTFRMCYDKARRNIRIHWNAQVIPREIFGGYKTTLHVDGISMYEIDRTSGNITQHRVERLIINDAMVMPEQGIFSALRRHAVKQNVGGSIPVFSKASSSRDAPASDSSIGHIVNFQSFAPFSRQYSTLFVLKDDDGNDDEQSRSSGMGGSPTKLKSMSSSSDAMDSTYNESIDWEAFERKNASRKKFGLAPLTPEEYADLQQQVAELDEEQRRRASANAAEVAKRKKEEEKGGFFKKLLGNALEDTCESNFDCQRPEVCCDFGFKKMCCTSGMRIMDGPPQSRQGQLAEIPVIANPNPYPPNGDGLNGRGGYPGY